MMMIWPLCKFYSIANNVSDVKEDGPVGGVGKGVGAEADIGGISEDEGATERGISEEGRASGLFPLAL